MTGDEFIAFVTERATRHVPSRVNPDGLYFKSRCNGWLRRKCTIHGCAQKRSRCLVIGDIFYHTAHDIQETPLFLVMLTSYRSGMSKNNWGQMGSWMEKEENNWDVTVIGKWNFYRSIWIFIKQVKKMHKELTERFIRYVKERNKIWLKQVKQSQQRLLKHVFKGLRTRIKWIRIPRSLFES